MTGLDDVLDWLGRREPAAPPGLRDRIVDAVRAAAGGGAGTAAGGGADDGAACVAHRLAEAALDRLRAVLEAPGARAAAPDLLAADALLTYACEAAAEAGPEALSAVTRAYGATRLANLISSEVG